MPSRLLVWLVGAVLTTVPGVTAEVVERILAVVDGRPIMLSEVKLLERVRGLDHTAARMALIDERLMYREASRLRRTAVIADDEERAFQDLLARLSAKQAAALDEAGLRRLVRREYAIRSYIEFRFRPQVRVSDEDLRKAYEEEHGGRDGAPAFEAVASTLRERLTAERLDQRIEAWVRELRAEAVIRENP